MYTIYFSGHSSQLACDLHSNRFYNAGFAKGATACQVNNTMAYHAHSNTIFSCIVQSRESLHIIVCCTKGMTCWQFGVQPCACAAFDGCIVHVQVILRPYSGPCWSPTLLQLKQQQHLRIPMPMLMVSLSRLPTKTKQHIQACQAALMQPKVLQAPQKTIQLVRRACRPCLCQGAARSQTRGWLHCREGPLPPGL